MSPRARPVAAVGATAAVKDCCGCKSCAFRMATEDCSLVANWVASAVESDRVWFKKGVCWPSALQRKASTSNVVPTVPFDGDILQLGCNLWHQSNQRCYPVGVELPTSSIRSSVKRSPIELLLRTLLLGHFTNGPSKQSCVETQWTPSAAFSAPQQRQQECLTSRRSAQVLECSTPLQLIFAGRTAS